MLCRHFKCSRSPERNPCVWTQLPPVIALMFYYKSAHWHDQVQYVVHNIYFNVTFDTFCFHGNRTWTLFFLHGFNDCITLWSNCGINVLFRSICKWLNNASHANVFILSKMVLNSQPPINRSSDLSRYRFSPAFAKMFISINNRAFYFTLGEFSEIISCKTPNNVARVVGATSTHICDFPVKPNKRSTFTFFMGCSPLKGIVQHFGKSTHLLGNTP